MRSLLQHRRKSKELSVRRFVDHDFLLILVDGRDPHPARHHHIRLPAGVADLVNALPRRERFQPHLPRQHRRLFFIQQRKQWNVLQYLRIACHRRPRRVKSVARALLPAISIALRISQKYGGNNTLLEAALNERTSFVRTFVSFVVSALSRWPHCLSPS